MRLDFLRTEQDLRQFGEYAKGPGISAPRIPVSSKSSIVWRFLATGLIAIASALLALHATVILLPGVGILICTAIALLVALIVTAATSYRLAAPIMSQLRSLQRFADAYPDAPRELLTGVDPESELGALAHSLQRMSSNVGNMVERLTAESTRAAAILSSMVEGVLAVDRQLRVVYCNRSFLNALGGVEPVKPGTPLRQLIRDPDLVGIITNILDSEEPVRQPVKIRLGRRRIFEVQATPQSMPSGGALLIFHDITELERLERVRQDFVANVSHELRTPLAAILGYAETLLDGGLEDPHHNREFVGVIRSHAMRLTDIASDLLTLARMESKDRAASRELVSVPEAVHAALEIVEYEAQSRGVELICGELDDVRIFGERTSFEQALLNLLSNAVKFNRPAGAVTVTSRACGENQTEIIVRDTGIGIASEHLTRIFERFYRVDKARSREVGGTGLGLSIVKHAVELLGGEIHVESQLGKGTAFVITLPVMERARSAIRSD